MPPRSTKAPKSAMFLTIPFADLADFEFLHQVRAVFFALILDQRTATDHDVAAGVVDLQNFGLDHAADEIADVAGATDVDLASGQEHVDTDVDQQAAFDFSDGRFR